MDAQFKSVRQGSRYNSRPCLILRTRHMASAGHVWEAPHVSLYFNPLATYKIAPVCCVASLKSSKLSWIGSEIAAPGLGVLYSLGGDSRSSLRTLIGVDPVDITEWGDLPFDRRQSVMLQLPPLRVEDPHPLGYGRKNEFTRWQTKQKIIWLVAEAKYPGSITASAVLWRLRPR